MPRLIMPTTLLLFVAIIVVARVVAEITPIHFPQAVVPSPTLNGIIAVVGVVGITQIDLFAKFVANRVMLLWLSIIGLIIPILLNPHKTCTPYMQDLT